MNGKVAKKIRKLVYGKNTNARFEQVVLESINVHEPGDKPGTFGKFLGMFSQKGTQPIRRAYRATKKQYNYVKSLKKLKVLPVRAPKSLFKKNQSTPKPAPLKVDTVATTNEDNQ